MTELLSTLYHFSLDHRIDPYLDADPEYWDNIECSEKKLAWLREHLAGDARAALEDYTTMRHIANSAFSECLFRAALVVGFELHHI